jgi:hypothetical protein
MFVVLNVSRGGSRKGGDVCSFCVDRRVIGVVFRLLWVGRGLKIGHLGSPPLPLLDLFLVMDVLG